MTGGLIHGINVKVAIVVAGVATSYGQLSGDGEVFGVSHMLQVMQQNGASCAP